MLTAACAFLLVLCALGGGYFLVVVPRRWRVPLREALALLEKEGNERTELETADRLLEEAVNAGPRGRDLADARFAHAFVRAMLGTFTPDQYWVASATVDGLAAAADEDPATAHLAVWLQYKLERHERAVELFQRHADSLTGRPAARRAAAASHLQLAGAHWRRRETDAAIRHFDRVRELGELTAEIPKAADSLHVLNGIQSHFDQRHTDARTAFGTARERAAALGRDTTEAELGLIACDWTVGVPNELDARLAQLFDRVTDVSKASAKEAKTAGADRAERTKDPAEEYRKQLRGVIALLRLVALLRVWRARPLSGELGARDRAELMERADTLREADPQLGDASLIEGLITYYFANGEEQREASLALLESGMRTAKGIVVPEVLHLVEKERALGSQGDAMSRFLRLVHELLADPTASAPHRAELRRLRDRFALYSDDLGGDLVLPHRPASPHELQQRINAMRRRIDLIVYPRLRDLPSDAPSHVLMRERLTELDDVALAFTEQAEALHHSELEILKATGELLLPQEELEDDDAAIAAPFTVEPSEPLGGVEATDDALGAADA
ncbi:hypothetical protein [Actinomadura decatromicini]|uniref:Tetratricopeptide repeat protein n=1 Tax=Actinomadura decatromicini TaxID=2604572 RepID=A0A5D3F5R2_9ACTN|nr:hypothetical protein [Actinomadura decatromicini]TYK43651.1 hypothetical protein FXF68_36470 [Actinomadura decatromicini]